MGLKPFILLSLSLLTAGYARGQRAAGDTVLKGSTIEVIQSYKPQVRQAPKPEWIPHLPPTDTSRQSLTFDVPQQTLYYTYTSEPLKPLALGKDTMVSSFPNYIKAGAGNLSTLMIDAGIGNLRGKNYETALHLHHLSQKGSLPSQQSANSGFEAQGVLHSKVLDWRASVSGARNQYYYFGYNHDLSSHPDDSIKQIYTAARINMEASNLSHLKRLLYTPSFSAMLYDARFNTAETYVGFKAPFTYTVDSTLRAYISLSGDFSFLKAGEVKTGNSLVTLLPGVLLNKGKLSGHGFMGFAAGKGGAFYVLPDIMAEYAIANTTLKLSGGWQAGVRRNTYEQLTTENPFLYNKYDVRQSRRDELYANVTGAYNKHISYTVRASWWNYKDLATYVNRQGMPGADRRDFLLMYNNVSALSLHGSVQYEVASVWSAGLAADYYNFYQGSQPFVWHQPTINVRAHLSAKPTKDLVILAYANVLGGIKAIDSASRVVTLSPVLDLGVNGEYRLVSRLNVFLQVSNLLNSKYQRWMGYQAYGLNVYGGLRLKF